MKIFISWSGALSHRIALRLKRWIPTVIKEADVFVSSTDISTGEVWASRLLKNLEDADYGIVCIVPGNSAEPWLLFEAGMLLKNASDWHESDQSTSDQPTFPRFCPFIFGLTPKKVKGPLGQFQCAEYARQHMLNLVRALNKLSLKVAGDQELDNRFTRKWPNLQLHLDRLLSFVPGRKEQPTGIVSPEQLRKSNIRLTDEVFAIECLTRPITLERREDGRVTVTVDRTGVEEMVYSNKGKMAMAQKYVTSKNKGALIEFDEEIQKFLADGGGESKLSIKFPKGPRRLRWASGGILSIVTDANGKQWIPLFFRDIRPYGWNIALGTTERWFDRRTKVLHKKYSLEDDLNNPHTFIMREFLEETLIVNGTPQLGGTLYYKSFQFDQRQSTFSEKRAKQFYRDHCILRKAKNEDGLTIKERGKIKVEFLPTKCSLIVYAGKDTKREDITAKTDNVLICFSLLDLGIEVVEVAKYKLGNRDWILDGEIGEKHNERTGETKKELIRMPTALLSVKYLRSIFGPGEDWHHLYTFGPQPSIRARRPPKPEEIIHFPFDWDAKRRMQAVEGEWDAKAMMSRYVDWYDKFGKHFVEDHENPDHRWGISYKHPSQLFVPGVAKILNLYFSTMDGKEKK